MNYFDRAKALTSELITNRRAIHQNPETGLELPKTYAYVWSRLEEMGYSPQACGPGITATVGEGDRTFLLRADMDALPMAEESGEPFAATNGNAHSCGHDMHSAMLLGAARLLKENEAALAGRVKLMFQPGEELLQGSKAMIEAGVLDGVDAAMGAHMMAMAPTGFVGYNTGVVSASSDTLHIEIQGKGGHAAMPNTAVDPINVGAHMFIAMQELISREVDPEETAVLTFGAFHAGSAHNIIPDTAELQGTLRTFNPEVRTFLLGRIREVMDCTAKTFRATAELSIPASTGSLVIDEGVADIVGPALQSIFGEGVRRMPVRMSGSEDFSEVSLRVPTMFIVVGGGAPEQGHHYALHHPKITFDEGALPVGAAAYAQGATAWLAASRG